MLEFVHVPLRYRSASRGVWLQPVEPVSVNYGEFFRMNDGCHQCSYKRNSDSHGGN